jgi:hypothetical protein
MADSLRDDLPRWLIGLVAWRAFPHLFRFQELNEQCSRYESGGCDQKASCRLSAITSDLFAKLYQIQSRIISSTSCTAPDLQS